MIVEIVATPIDDTRLIAHVNRPGNGGLCTFHGVVRDNLDGRAVVRLDYEAYEPMALAKMRDIAAEIGRRWGTADVAIVHRIGKLQIGEASVVIAVGAPHRAAAFDACRFAIDTLKTTVPIWKKEFFEDGAVWVEPSPSAAPTSSTTGSG